MQFQSINKTKGILYAAVSSSTFGLAPFFSVMLLNIGFSSFEVLSYRWGIASLTLILFGWLSGCNFRLNKKDFGTVFLLSLFRAATSLSLLIAYQNIASGVASIIHFMYPLAVAMSMILFFHEKRSAWIITAISMSIVGAILLSSGNIGHGNGSTTLGIISASYIRILLRRIHYRSKKKPCSTDRIDCADLLCNGIRSASLHHLRLFHQWHPAGNRRCYLAVHLRISITGYSHFKHHTGQGNQAHRPYPHLHIRGNGTSDGSHHRHSSL